MGVPEFRFDSQLVVSKVTVEFRTYFVLERFNFEVFHTLAVKCIVVHIY